MEAVLDFSRDLDVALLDKLTSQFFSSAGATQRAAQQVLTQFQAHPDAWTRVDAILERAQLVQTKYIALQVLEDLIKTRWNILPVDQRQGIKNFIVGVVIKTSSDETQMTRDKTYLNKLNLILVQILKQEWPHNWPTFITEIVSSSRTNLFLCENNMVILKLMSEEIFDYSAEQMTQGKAKNLKNQMCNEFSEIFQLCHEIMEKAQRPSLVKATLETLLRFLNWIPLGYIFETNLIEILLTRFLSVAHFRNVTIKCLTEIGGLQVGAEYNAKFVQLYSAVVKSISQSLAITTDFAQLWDNASNDEQEFVQNLALFFSSFLAVHARIVEAADTESLVAGHMYLLGISRVPERELFKICLEYWYKLVSELYQEQQSMPAGDLQLFNMGGGASAPMQPGARKHMYKDVLSRLRVVMIDRMVKPEEVLIVENDEGEIVREFVKESDTIVLYKSMREALVYLTHLDTEETEAIMSEKLYKQVDGSEWTWDNLNKLCWAVGSISGAMTEDREKRFLVLVIKELLGLCEMVRGKDNKAVVASNIMYVVGQYPRFLKAHWKFLKTVVNKNFEFMHESHEGVQDMACDTFMKIAQKCKRHFVMQQPGEIMPFIDEILDSIESITSDLSPQQVTTFYEAVGYMISAQPNKQTQDRLITKYMQLPNAAWSEVLANASQNMEILTEPDTIKTLGHILKTNVAGCISVGAPFFIQIGRIYMDLMNLYKTVSQLISQAVATQGNIATKTPRVRGLRTIKKEALKLIETYISKADDLEAVNTNMIPPLMDAVLRDYQSNVEPAREAEVLSVMSEIVGRLGELMIDKIPTIMDSVFACTLNMINKDFEEYPEHRVAFFKLLRTINKQCFPAILAMSQQDFKVFLDSIIWAFKHTMRDIGDIGLSIVLDLLNNFTRAPAPAADAFFGTYFIPLLQDIFFVLTDRSHKTGFKSQAMILATMITLVDSGQLTARIFDPTQVPNPNWTNTEFLKEYITRLLQNAFPHLQLAQFQRFVLGLFEFHTDQAAFKLHLRDFLIQLKEFAGDNSELYLDEKEAELEEKRKREMDAALRIPGMVKPHDRPDEGGMME